MPGSTTRQSLVTSVSIKRPLTTGFRSLLILVILLALVAAGMAWDNLQQHRKAHQRIIDTDARLATLEQRVQALQDSQNTAVGQVQQQQAELDKLLAGGSAARQHWLLARAGEGVGVAEQSLALNRNVAAARLALAGVDTLLAAQPDATLLPLRRALHNDLDMLSALPAPDVDGLYLRLQLLDRHLQAIDLPREIGQRPPAASPTVTPTATDTLRQRWEAGLAHFRNLVVIRQYDQPLQPLLDEARRQLLKQQMSILIEQAEQALLRGDSLIYRSSLEALSLRLQQDLSALPHATLGPLLNELADLQAQQIQVDIPALASHAALDALAPVSGGGATL